MGFHVSCPYPRWFSLWIIKSYEFRLCFITSYTNHLKRKISFDKRTLFLRNDYWRGIGSFSFKYFIRWRSIRLGLIKPSWRNCKKFTINEKSRWLIPIFKNTLHYSLSPSRRKIKPISRNIFISFRRKNNQKSV